MALRVLKCDIDGMTAHVTAQVVVVEKLPDGNITIGPTETVGIDSSSLMRIYHEPNVNPTTQSIQNALRAWLAKHHTGAIQRKRAIDSTSLAVSLMQGQTLELDEDEAGK
jgi:hypothetical protein